MRKLALAAALAASIPMGAVAAPGHGGWHGGRGVGGGWHSGWHGGDGWSAPRYWGGWGGAVVIGPAYYPAPYYGWYYAPVPVYYPAYAPVVVEERVYDAAPPRPAHRAAPPVAREPSTATPQAPAPGPYHDTTTDRGGAALPSKADRN